MGGIGGVDDPALLGDASYQTFAQTHAGFMDGFGVQAFGRAKLKRLGIAEQIDGAHFRAHRIGDQMGDAIKPRLPCAVLSQSGPQALQ